MPAGPSTTRPWTCRTTPGSAILLKASGRAGLGASGLLLAMAAATIVTGLAARWLPISQQYSGRGVVLALAAGRLWAVCQLLIFLAVSRWQTPVAKLVPLYNMNTLVAVLSGLVVFAEYQDVSLPKLVIGSVLIVIGGVLVAQA